MNEASTATRTYVRDPICGMDIDPATATHRVEHGGSPYYFCGARCAETFRKDPGAALAKASTPDAAKSCCQGSKGDRGSTQQDEKAAGKYRTEERRVGKGWGRTCKYRGGPNR